MKLAIHHIPSIYNFSDQWIRYCEENNIHYKKVDCLDSDIIDQLKDCDGLLWHWSHHDYKSMLIARQLIISFQKLGIRVYPDVNTSWHFDDKIGQKYLLEAIGAPLVPTYVFYSKKKALEWVNSTTFPKVFKLRGGAASINVRLVKNKRQAIKIVKKAFSTGFQHFNKYSSFNNRILKFKKFRDFKSAMLIPKGLIRLFIPPEDEKFWGNDKGYVYFQDFIPDNNYDTRLIVIGNRCFGIRRYNRQGDFRASGSGKFTHDPDLIETKCVKLAFEISGELDSQSMAFDFIMDNGKYLLVEISFCFIAKGFYNCNGYWDKDLTWHNAKTIPEHFIIEDLINS